MCIEPELHSVTGKELSGLSTNSQSGAAHLDIAANGVWGGTFERTYFDVRVFNPHAPSSRQANLQSVYESMKNSRKTACKGNQTCYLLTSIKA